ncbi:hypothetical protein GGH92_000169, partial [Coemansia sp. RSA 2673]
MEDLETDEKFDHINMFFCLNQLDVSLIGGKIEMILKDKGEVRGIAMFEEDVSYISTESFTVKKDQGKRIISIPGSHVIDVRESTVAFSQFHSQMSKYFFCKEIVSLGDDSQGRRLNHDEEKLNSMYSRFTYVKRRRGLGIITNYLQSFTGPLRLEGQSIELELRAKINSNSFDSIRNIVIFDSDYNNSYRYYDLHLHDQRLREYTSGKRDMKSLMFRKKEKIWGLDYYVCLSSEIEARGNVNNKILRGKTVMKRWAKKLEWGGDLFLSKRLESYELEVEFDSVSVINMARRFFISLMRQVKIGFNSPVPLEESMRRLDVTEIERSYVISTRPSGKRVFIFSVGGLGVWAWGESQEIVVLSESSGNDIVMDAVLTQEGVYVVTDIADDKSTHAERMSTASSIVRTWKKIYEFEIEMADHQSLSKESMTKVYVSSKCYSYTSFAL